jgi:hypothetical protein
MRRLVFCDLAGGRHSGVERAYVMARSSAWVSARASRLLVRVSLA